MYLLPTLHCNGFYLQTVTCHDLAPAASLTMWNMWNSERLNCGPYLHVGLVNWPLFISDQLVVCPSSCSAAAERVVLTFSAGHWSFKRMIPKISQSFTNAEKVPTMD